MAKCPACPVAETSCVGECAGGPAFCALAATEDGRRHLLGRSRSPCPGHTPPETAAERRAKKRRMALGQPQKADPECVPCQAAAALAAAQQAQPREDPDG